MADSLSPPSSLSGTLRRGHGPAGSQPVRRVFPPRLAAFVWERVQNTGKIAIGFGLIITILYVVGIAIPMIAVQLRASPIFPDWPKVNGVILLVHAVTAVPPLVTGIVLFSKRIRKVSLKWHRWAGTVYCVCIWISATLGIMLAVANTNGWFAQMGFALLGFAWFTTTWYAYRHGRRKDIASHRRWMIRSYALTLAVVSIRPMFWFGPWYGMSESAWYIFITWQCWVPNLILAEAYIRLTRNNGMLKYGAQG